jgi:phenylacetate-coenzyme A ligase PaaK-like adenylate-forming protein
VAAIGQTRRRGAAAVDAVARERLAELVAHTRARSPFYRDAWRGLGAGVPALADLPPVRRQELMARFDDWVTDPAVTRAGVDAFTADPRRIGQRFLGRYVVWKSSGTRGVPGIYVQDPEALATYDALIGAQFGGADLLSRFAWGALASGGRAALITAVEDHYAGIASWRRLAGIGAGLARSFSVLAPLAELVAALNGLQPAYLASYPTMLALLADEQVAGRLHIAPAILWSGGECLPPARRREIERVFGCPIANEYGASECMSIAFGCREGALHVNADWALLEPVDRDYRPTPAGEPSHTVLLTNLANRVQPVVRYDLGDSVTVRPGRCRCGSPLPMIDVEGRRDDIPTLCRRDGTAVRLVPLALATVVEQAVDLHRFQVVQDAPDRLRLRLDADEGASDAERRSKGRVARQALRAYLEQQGLPDVRVVHDERSPAADAASGKRRQVIVTAPIAPPPRRWINGTCSRGSAGARPPRP